MSAVLVSTKELDSTWKSFGNFVRFDFGTFLNNMTVEDFEQLCLLNRDRRFERNQNGDILIMAPVHTETGGRNFDLAVELGIWAKIDGTGKGFDSSTGFTLSNGAIRSPDVSWVRLARLDALPPEKRRKFAHIAPDFVIELRSSSDAVQDLQDKMDEYIANGVQLGWLIDTKRKRVHVYRPDAEAEVLRDPLTVDGSPVLTGFVLRMAEIWG